MLTTAAAKAAIAGDRAYKLADAGGLHLFVALNGSKTWRFKYRMAGREKLLTIGRFPAVSLPEARAAREAAKEQLRAGVDPSSSAAKAEAPATLEQLARAWIAFKRPSWSTTHATDVLGSLERIIFPALGKKSLEAVTPNELLNAIRSVEQRGTIVTAQRLRQRLSEIFGFGIAQGLATSNPAEQLGAAMRAAPPVRAHRALTDIADCRALLAACDAAIAPVSVRFAGRLLALTAVRLEAVRGMRWCEVEDLDGAAPLWRVPPARMKLKRAKKDVAALEHLVPLSAEAVAVLRAARVANLHSSDADLHGPDALVFAGRGGTAPIGEGAIRALIAAAGFADRHVPHGWRSSFSTILNEQLGNAWSNDIERALAHTEKDKVKAAYDRAQQLPRRRELFARWGAMLTE